MKKGCKPASKMREAASLALPPVGTERSHHNHLREVTTTLQKICVGGYSSEPAASSSESHHRNQLFSERFMQQKCSTGAHHPALVAMERELSSSYSVKEIQKAGGSGNGGISPFRQQSLPRGMRAHSQHSKRTWQQSIPCKSSPRQPLLEKRHRINSTPALVLSETKSKLKSNSAPPVHNARYNSMYAHNSSGSPHALPKVNIKKERCLSVDILQEKKSPDSHRNVHSRGVRSRIRKSVSHDHHSRHSAASKRQSLSSRDPSCSSVCSCSGASDRSFDSASYSISGGSSTGGDDCLEGM